MKSMLFGFMVLVFVTACADSPAPVGAPEAQQDAPLLAKASPASASDRFDRMDFQWKKPSDFEITTEKGEWARSYWENGSTISRIWVIRDHSERTLYLTFYVVEQNRRIAYGNGFLPFDKLSGSYESGTMHLDVDVSQVPGFLYYPQGSFRIVAHWQSNQQWTRYFGGYSFFRDHQTRTVEGFAGRRVMKSTEGWATIGPWHYTQPRLGGLFNGIALVKDASISFSYD